MAFARGNMQQVDAMQSSYLQEQYTILKGCGTCMCAAQNLGCAAAQHLTPSRSPSRCPRCYRAPCSSRPVILKQMPLRCCRCPIRGGLDATCGMAMPHPHAACQLQGLLLQVAPRVLTSGGPRHQRVLAGPRHCHLLAQSQAQSWLLRDCCWHCNGSSSGQEGRERCQ